MTTTGLEMDVNTTTTSTTISTTLSATTFMAVTNLSSITTLSPKESAATHYRDTLIGCGLAMGGNLLISVSLNLQKYTHVRNSLTGSQIHYTRQPLWWLGLLLMGFGEVGNFSAYGFAPASLVAPLGTTTVVANMFLAVIFLKEKLRPEDLFGSTLAVVGAFLLVNFSSKSETILSANDIMSNLREPVLIVYIIVELIGLSTLLVLKYKFKIENVLTLLLICSLLASFTVITAKGVSGMLQLTLAGKLQLHHFIFWVMLVVMLVTAIVQVKFLNQAMKLNDSTVVVPTNFVFFTISAICAGIIFYKEFWGLSALEVFMFLFGCIMCFVGVYFITAGRTSPDESAVSENPDEVVKASNKRSSFLNFIPSWLLSRVSRSEVQPRNEPHHHHTLQADQIPILSRDNDDSDYSYHTGATDEETVIDSIPDLVVPNGNSYGAFQK